MRDVGKVRYDENLSLSTIAPTDQDFPSSSQKDIRMEPRGRGRFGHVAGQPHRSDPATVSEQHRKTRPMQEPGGCPVNRVSCSEPEVPRAAPAVHGKIERHPC